MYVDVVTQYSGYITRVFHFGHAYPLGLDLGQGGWYYRRLSADNWRRVGHHRPIVGKIFTYRLEAAYRHACAKQTAFEADCAERKAA